jgi:GT2 family glycosyltransferase
MLSDDCLVVPGAIKNGYALFEEKMNKEEKVGAIAFYFRNYPVDDFYYVGLTFGKIFVNHGMFYKKGLEEVGYIDEDSYLFYHADGDLCLKLWQAGYSCIDSPNSFIEHYAHANITVRNTNLDNQKRDWNNFSNKWKDIFISTIPADKQYIKQDHHDRTSTADKFQRIMNKKNFKFAIMSSILKNIFKSKFFKII